MALLKKDSLPALVKFQRSAELACDVIERVVAVHAQRIADHSNLIGGVGCAWKSRQLQPSVTYGTYGRAFDVGIAQLAGSLIVSFLDLIRKNHTEVHALAAS